MLSTQIAAMATTASPSQCQMCQKYKKIATDLKESKKLLAVKTKKILERLKETKQQLDARDKSTTEQLDLLSKKLQDMEQAKSEAAEQYEDRISNLKSTFRRNEEKREEERKTDLAKFEADKRKLEETIENLNKDKTDLSAASKANAEALGTEISRLKEKNLKLLSELQTRKIDIDKLVTDAKTKEEMTSSLVSDVKQETVRAVSNDIIETDSVDSADKEDSSEVLPEPNVETENCSGKDSHTVAQHTQDLEIKLESSIMKNKSLEEAYTNLQGQADETQKSLQRKQDMLKKLAERYKDIQKKYKALKLEQKRTQSSISQNETEMADKNALLSSIQSDLKSKSEALNNANLEIEELRKSLELVREEVSRNDSAHEEHIKDLEEQMELRCKYSLTNARRRFRL